MLAALEARPVCVSAPGPVPGLAGAVFAPTSAEVAQRAEQMAALPDVVVQACEHFGFGDREEVSRNYRRAAELHAQGRDAMVIVKEIRQGADTTGLFV